MTDLLIVLGAIVLVILSSTWWPAIGRAWWDWRFNHMLICWGCRRYMWSTLLRDQPGTPRHRRCQRKWVMPAWTGPDSPQAPVPVDDDPPADDGQDWADELHAINLATHRDRPVHQLTHYEIEAVIRDLGVPEWVPERWRQAA